MTARTIRLRGRDLHLVRDMGECAHCPHHAGHRRLDQTLLFRNELASAVLDDGPGSASLRDLASTYGLLYHVHRLSDSAIVAQISHLLDGGALIAVECLRPQHERSVPAAPAEGPTVQEPRRPRVPVDDLKTWIEIELLTEAGKPVPHEEYRIKLPDGVVDEGALDGKGRARIDGIDPGTCEVSFPRLDAREIRYP